MDFASATSGFIGRSLIFNDRETAPPTKPNFLPGYTGPDKGKPAMSSDMVAKLTGIYDDGNFDMTAGKRVEYYGARKAIPTDAAAGDMLMQSLHWFERQAVLHKSRSGLEALYLRAYEMVSKVSLILAVHEGVRRREHVRWAFALVRRDVEDKSRLVIANDREKENPMQALEARITNLIAGEDGNTLGVIRNKIKNRTREDVDKALANLVQRGVAYEHEINRAGPGRTSVRFSTTKPDI